MLERAAELQALDTALSSVGVRSPGRLVLVGGDAGVGKTALVRRFCDECAGRARVLWGACDALFTPRPLGPLFDVAEGVGGELEALVVAEGGPREVVAALRDELRTRSPTVLVLEDVHWADEATLDVVRLLARRLEAIPALVVATYRDDELESTHALRVVLGDLAAQRGVERIRLAPLSRDAVAALAATSGLDAAELHRVTGGNPFFVTEVLAAGGEEIPATVRDAVMARIARLSGAARRGLEALAIVPGEVELWLLEALAPEAGDCLDESLASGMLAAGRDAVSYRHELARLAVEEALAPNQRLALHRRALAALAAPPGEAPDLTRLAHHAEAAGDRDAVLRFAPAAAAHASEHGAHREAAAQYARALRLAAGQPPAARADLLERQSRECFLIDDSSGAIEALEGALICHRELGDDLGEAGALTALANVLWCPGRIAEALESAERAVSLLQRRPPGRALVSACAVLATLHKDAEDPDPTREWALRAIALADGIGDRELSLHASITLHGMALLRGDPLARGRLETCREQAARAGIEEQVGRVWVHLAWGALRHRAYATAEADLTAGLEHAHRHGLDVHELYLIAYRARWQLDRGEWDEAPYRRDRAATYPRVTPAADPRPRRDRADRSPARPAGRNRPPGRGAHDRTALRRTATDRPGGRGSRRSRLAAGRPRGRRPRNRHRAGTGHAARRAVAGRRAHRLATPRRIRQRAAAGASRALCRRAGSGLGGRRGVLAAGGLPVRDRAQSNGSR